jgi:hypothetical protein
MLRRLMCLAGGIGLALIMIGSANAASVTLASDSLSKPSCSSANANDSCFLIDHPFSFNLATPVTASISITEGGGGFSSVSWQLAGPSALGIYGTAFGDPLPNLTNLSLVAGAYQLHIIAPLNKVLNTTSGLYTTDGAEVSYSVVAATPIPGAALLFGSGLTILGAFGLKRKKTA